jgi:hypothetical protein
VKRETRANLLFLAVFLGISLPGLVVLFKKKLDPQAPPMYLPDPVKTRLPYMAPVLAPPEVTRVIPEKAGRWVTELARRRAGQPEMLLEARHPVISVDRGLQLVGIQEASGRNTLSLLAWSEEYPAVASQYQVAVECGGKPRAAKMVGAEEVAVPSEVRTELIYGGYAKPPRRVVWLTAEVEGAAPLGRPLVVRVSRTNVANGTASVRLDASS